MSLPQGVSIRRPGDRFALVAVFLILADVVFMAIHMAFEFVPGVDDPMFSLSVDRSHAEFFNYIKYVWLGAAMLWCTWASRTWRYLSWVVLFGIFLLDDSFELHERLGEVLVGAAGLPDVLGLRGQDFAEIIVMGSLGLVVAALVALAWRGSDRAFRTLTREFAILLVALVVVGVGLDLMHSAVDLLDWRPGSILFGALEDGGEMVVVSLMVWRALEHLQRLLTPAVRDEDARVEALSAE